MKTIKQIAEELGVSTQAIYKKINKTMQSDLQPFVEVVSGKTLMADSGVEIIRKSLQPVDNGLQSVANCADVEFYKQQIEFLQAELKAEREYSRKQGEELAALSKDLARLTENGQILLREQNLKSLAPSESEKVSWWSRLFRREK